MIELITAYILGAITGLSISIIAFKYIIVPNIQEYLGLDKVGLEEMAENIDEEDLELNEVEERNE